MTRVLLAVAMTLAIAAPASAASFGMNGSSIVYQAAAGEKNEPSINYSSSGLISASQYSGPPLTAGPGCSNDQANPGTIDCPQAGVGSVVLNLGDGDDRLQINGDVGANLPPGIALKVNGGSGKDTIFATKGNDTLLGGTGADRLYGSGGKDLLDGGPGNDRLQGQGTVKGGTGNDYLTLFLLDDFRVKSLAFGGAGDDHILGGNKVRDVIDCGAGRKDQFTTSDKRGTDKVRSNCELHF